MLESLVAIHRRRSRAYLHVEGVIRVVPNVYLRFEGLVTKYKRPKNRMIPVVFRRSYFGYRVLAPP